MTKKGKLIYVSLLAVLMFGVVSCDVFQQVQQAINLLKCDFKLNNVTQMNLAGVNIDNKTSYSQLNLGDIGKLSAAYLTKNMPLKFQLNIDVKNPNSQPASLSKLDWQLFIDDIQMVTGITDHQLNVPANGGVSTFPLQIGFNLFDILQDKGMESIANFALNLAGQGSNPTRFTLKAKPTIYVNSLPITYPGYISITTEYTGNQ